MFTSNSVKFCHVEIEKPYGAAWCHYTEVICSTNFDEPETSKLTDFWGTQESEFDVTITQPY